MPGPHEQDDWTTLEAELRQAVQHQQAAYEQMRETQREVEALMARARELLAQVQEAREPDASAGSG